jgi:uncharacterized protein
VSDAPSKPHLPRPAPIDGYGKGGFRFAGMSHRGSLLCLPSGVWAWAPTRPADITEASLAELWAEANAAGHVLIGAGTGSWAVPEELRARFRASGLTFEVMRTGTAVSTYNILLGEGRRIAAALIAVD